MQELKQEGEDEDDFTPLPPLEESPLRSRNKVSSHDELGLSEAKPTRFSMENQQRQEEEGSEDGQSSQIGACLRSLAVGGMSSSPQAFGEGFEA
ncbi:hypothetical protein NL676_033823 [Syzygium grande]|nr:hypothetical protein NL676_033823 [Syzygium grande]